MNTSTETQKTSPTTITYNTESAPVITKRQVSLLPLYNEQNPMLKLKLAPFDFKNKSVDIVEFARQLDATMSHYGGVGLAANQCGFPHRMFVMAGGMVCINPKILEKSTEEVREKEGCLSFPGLIIPITRAATIRVEYYTVAGDRREETFTGSTAQVFQHEYDHLEGKVYTQLVGPLTLQMAKKKRQKLFKKMERIATYKAAVKGTVGK
jgi:peptide deformylase